MIKSNNHTFFLIINVKTINIVLSFCDTLGLAAIKKINLSLNILCFTKYIF